MAATPNAARLARGSTNAAPVTQVGKRRFGMRILPITAFVAALVLTVKIGGLWDARERLPAAFEVGTPAGAKPTEAEPPTQLAAAEKPVAGSGATMAGDEKLDPFALGKSQIELLQSLAERRKELEERERALDQREGLLAAAEHRIEQKIAEMTKIKGEIEALIKKYDEQEEAQLKSVVKIYETMKPKDAARIFDEMDMDVLLQVINRMKASKTAPVLANMSPARAKEITTRITERREMPDIN
ncbi:MAG: hypothetical protein HQ481_19850 [Alphaproteobacteria bacterium]|nr:hypothetical protein [Alphaproteobacteria bacterium]